MKSVIITVLFLSEFVYFSKTEVHPESRIIGGQTVSSTQFPWVVDIRLISSTFDLIGQKWCAGSIITSNWIVTTANCATLSTDRYRIIAGTYDILLPNFLTIQPRQVTVKSIHPAYNSKTQENNIALMRVFPPFQFDNFTSSIQYAHFNFYANGTGTIVGWGARDNTDVLGPRFLQTGIVYLLQNINCQNIFLNKTIYPSQICGSGASSSPCTGDDGGPLMCNRNNMLILCGIISDTKGCQRGLPPKIYTRTSPFYNWLQVGTTY